MTKETLTPEELVNKLLKYTDYNLTKLAKELKLSRQTITNWRQGITPEFSTKSLQKIEQTLQKHDHDWGLQLGNISNSTVEIILLKEKAVNYSPNSKSTDNNNDDELRKMKELVISLTQKVILLENDNKFLQHEIDRLNKKSDSG